MVNVMERNMLKEKFKCDFKLFQDILSCEVGILDGKEGVQYSFMLVCY